MLIDSVSIIGAGNCGCALAADLLSRGKRVMLYSHPLHNRNACIIHKRGGFKSVRELDGWYNPQLSLLMSDAIRFSNVIIITVPAYGHDSIIAELSQFDLSEHTIICITGNFFSLLAKQQLNAKEFVETSTSPYSSRFENGQLHVKGIKKCMMVGSIPKGMSNTLKKSIEDIFPMTLKWCENILEISLSCISGVIHPTPMLMNSGWIEASGSDFYFYKDGMSPSVVKVMEAIDKERKNIAVNLGLDVCSMIEIMNMYYGCSYDNYADFARESKTHNSMPTTPHNLQHRYINQDVPYVLVPWYKLGVKFGITSPIIESIIRLASTVNSVNYFESGRSLHALAIDGYSKEKLIDACEKLGAR
ncbi:NAD/NADP octopine/nopaline dehydrogenase family protein [Aeromonas enteropelogenes]|uniref:NAD/NADP octopine/nopaline dehydrogenase family protein n=1 Tax=Aeromonas enteropelogenes TaxID=29489 RepID=UPI003988A40A